MAYLPYKNFALVEFDKKLGFASVKVHSENGLMVPFYLSKVKSLEVLQIRISAWILENTDLLFRCSKIQRGQDGNPRHFIAPLEKEGAA